ncbi:MAG: hypothetical protein H6565_16750 [Lewinellaceae bacterium]|nr:hypothetical protein [Lewinellaceae bacterium]
MNFWQVVQFILTGIAAGGLVELSSKLYGSPWTWKSAGLCLGSLLVFGLLSSLARLFEPGTARDMAAAVIALLFLAGVIVAMRYLPPHHSKTNH